MRKAPNFGPVPVMPIRFRCHHCDQLMGIARRKAGSVVNCPSCHKPLTVPLPEPRADPSKPPIDDVFDRDDFDVILQREPPPLPPSSRGAAAVGTAPSPASSVGTAESQALSVPASRPPAAGLVLSPARATALTVVLIVLLALSFVGGMLVGRFAL